MKKKLLLILFSLFIFIKTNSQNHHFGILTGYTISSATVPDGNLSFTTNGLEQGQDFFDFKNGFQIGLLANIDIGNDFYHLDLSPQFSQYGFGNQQSITLNYLDFDIGSSNFFSEIPSKFVFGGGITPAILISSKNIEKKNDFDLKVYVKFGFKFNENLIFYTQMRYSFLELVPDSKIKNFQLNFNLNYRIFKL